MLENLQHNVQGISLYSTIKSSGILAAKTVVVKFTSLIFKSIVKLPESGESCIAIGCVEHVTEINR